MNGQSRVVGGLFRNGHRGLIDEVLHNIQGSSIAASVVKWKHALSCGSFQSLGVLFYEKVNRLRRGTLSARQVQG
eukprot:scaffold9272_cov195-Amphora_coffeaeformis.AAC.14